MAVSVGRAERQAGGTGDAGEDDAPAAHQPPAGASTVAAGLASLNEDDQIVLRTDKPLPATAFATVGEVVASLEHLAETLAPPAPVRGDEAEEAEP